MNDARRAKVQIVGRGLETIVMPTKIKDQTCEVCGEAAVWKSRLSPMGFVKSDRNCGYTRWIFYYYCKEHLHDANEQLWSRLQPYRLGV